MVEPLGTLYDSRSGHISDEYKKFSALVPQPSCALRRTPRRALGEIVSWAFLNNLVAPGVMSVPSIGPFVVDSARRTVWTDHTAIALPGKAFELLCTVGDRIPTQDLLMIRWRIAILVSAAITISYLDRQTLPVAIGEISKDIPITNQVKAFLDSAFLLTYGLMYVGGGD